MILASILDPFVEIDIYLLAIGNAINVVDDLDHMKVFVVMVIDQRDEDIVEYTLKCVIYKFSSFG